jgi:hypothetical protein
MTATQRSLGENLSGWWLFAGVMMLIAGGFNVIEGVAALANEAYFDRSGLLYDSLTFWGWVILIIGILQLATCRFIYQRSQTGAILGIAMATVSAFAAFLAIGGYPLWAIIILVLDGLVIYGLTRAPIAD